LQAQNDPKALAILAQRFGKDTLLSLATTESGRPAVRIVDSYYGDGAFYTVTYALSNKMRQIEAQPEVAVCGEWFTARGIGENLGHVGDIKNAALAAKLRDVFSSWYSGGHVDESDPNTCILRVRLTDGVLFSEGARYELVFLHEENTERVALTEILETERLLLRPLAADDFEAVHAWASNPANIRYMSFGPNSEEQTRQFLASAKPGRDFAVVLKESGRVIGSCGIAPDKAGDTAEIGWILHMDHWKHGYGTELGGALIRYGFEELKLRRIFATCAAVNYGSYRVMERNGMRREALHRKAKWARIDREWIDRASYAILAEEYFSIK
jgi:RimJ/RimL family protein N-acetyltransferase/general stress protein 26